MNKLIHFKKKPHDGTKVQNICLGRHITIIVRDALLICGSIVVSISACHAEDPGSIPGRGISTSACGTPRGASPDPARALHKARPKLECFHSSAG